MIIETIASICVISHNF